MSNSGTVSRKTFAQLIDDAILDALPDTELRLGSDGSILLWSPNKEATQILLR